MGDPLLHRSETLVPSKIVLICSTHGTCSSALVCSSRHLTSVVRHRVPLRCRCFVPPRSLSFL
jgi:hypothetical protein